MSVKSFTFKGSLGSVKSTDSVATPIGSGLSSFFFLNLQVCRQETQILERTSVLVA